MNLEDLFAGVYQAGRSDESAEQQRRAYIMTRRQCEESGHQYQVEGSKSPIGLKCKRCRCAWQIGPKTEPALS